MTVEMCEMCDQATHLAEGARHVSGREFEAETVVMTNCSGRELLVCPPCADSLDDSVWTAAS